MKTLIEEAIVSSLEYDPTANDALNLALTTYDLKDNTIIIEETISALNEMNFEVALTHLRRVKLYEPV